MNSTQRRAEHLLQWGTLWSTLLLQILPVVIWWVRAARRDIVATTDAERRKETHYWDRTLVTKVVPFALETYGALCDRSDRLLVECAALASRGCARSGPSISLLCTCFRQRVSIALQRSLAHAMSCYITSCTDTRVKLLFITTFVISMS